MSSYKRVTAYQYVDEDSDERQDAEPKYTNDREVQAQIGKITQSFQQIDRELKVIEQHFMTLKREGLQGDAVLKTQKNIDGCLENLRTKLLPGSMTEIQKFQKQIVVLQAPANVKQQLQKTQQSCLTQFNQKQSQIQQLTLQFQKLSNKIDDTLHAQTQDEDYQIKDFKFRQMEEDIDAELDDIKRINRDVNDMNSMMQIMSTEVDKQQDTINVIEEKVGEADSLVNNGAEQLREARKQQKSKNKWLWIGLGALLILIVVLLIIFVF